MRVKLPDRDRHGVSPDRDERLIRSLWPKTTPGWCDVNGTWRMRPAHLVMPGLDPGIHQSSQGFSKWMDCRVI